MSRMRSALHGLLGGLLLLAGVAHAGTRHYYYTDPQGTVLAKADAQGNIIASYDYAPYGTQALGTPPNGPGYTGHVNDPDTGLVYMQARYYDPAIGRFLSTDPVGPSAGNAFNFNRYAYASNNPIVNIDPDGRQDSPSTMERLFPKGDIFRVTGNAMAADVAYMQGAITGNDALKSEALSGMKGDVSDGGGGAAVASLLLMGKGGDGAPAKGFEMTPKPLMGRNPEAAGSRTNTDAGPNGNRATAKSVFRNQAEGSRTTSRTSNGGIRTRAENGVQIRHNADGSSRVDLPNRGPAPNGETLHTPPSPLPSLPSPEQM